MCACKHIPQSIVGMCMLCMISHINLEQIFCVCYLSTQKRYGMHRTYAHVCKHILQSTVATFTFSARTSYVNCDRIVHTCSVCVICPCSTDIKHSFQCEEWAIGFKWMHVWATSWWRTFQENLTWTCEAQRKPVHFSSICRVPNLSKHVHGCAAIHRKMCILFMSQTGPTTADSAIRKRDFSCSTP